MSLKPSAFKLQSGSGFRDASSFLVKMPVLPDSFCAPRFLLGRLWQSQHSDTGSLRKGADVITEGSPTHGEWALPPPFLSSGESTITGCQEANWSGQLNLLCTHSEDQQPMREKGQLQVSGLISRKPRSEAGQDQFTPFFPFPCTTAVQIP